MSVALTKKPELRFRIKHFKETASTNTLAREYAETGEKEGAKIIADGRGVKVPDAPNGFFMGATIVDQVQDEMTIAREEVFGPVLNVMRADDVDQAIAIANKSASRVSGQVLTRQHSRRRAGQRPWPTPERCSSRTRSRWRSCGW